MNPKVSVVIPVFNRAHTIKRSLTSAIQQTYSNLEIIVVDDGSSDETYEVAKSFSDKRVDVIRLNKNYGVSKARNIGIISSTGQFIAFLDADDEWFKNKIEEQISYINRCHHDVDVLDCDWVVHNKRWNTHSIKTNSSATNLQKLLSFQHICSPPTVIVRRSVLLDVGGFDESISTAEDADLWVRLSHTHKFSHLSKVLVKIYRGHRRRLGLNVQSFIRGHLRFYVKHKNKYDYKKESLFFLTVGHNLLLMGRNTRGRKYIVRSIMCYPFGLKKYLLFILTFFSYSFYSSLRYIKNKTSSVWGRYFCKDT